MQSSLVQEIPYEDPITLFSVFADQQGSILLDSALHQDPVGRFSYIAADPFLIFTDAEAEQQNPFDFLSASLKKFSQTRLPNLPVFQGGVAGYFGYELFRHLETIPLAQTKDMQFPEMMLGFYDVVIAFDHVEKKSWLFSSGFPEVDEAKQNKRAQERLHYFLEKISVNPLREDRFVSVENIQPHFTKETYCQAVQKVIDYILAGDIFQANLTQRFAAALPQYYDSFDLYKRLRTLNPATFAAYLNFGNTTLVSASPERFIKLENHQVETRPIKGTRKRGMTAQEDEAISQALLASAKDNAENVMIVDLLRNDLSRVCEPGSVTVSKLCGLETFATVHHLVSVVHGKLKSNYDAIDLLRATFPGGSITGAPKIRAMEIISELEPTHRGPYCGSIGYITWNGDMDTSITIRTLCIQENKASFQAGGAIVADSVPEEEYEETILKASAIVKALAGVA